MNARSSAWIASVCVVTAALVGTQNGPLRPRAAIWYLWLRKPGYTPPGPAVGAAWVVLEIALGVSGYRLLRRPPSQARTITVSAWGAALLGLAGFPILFFGKRRLVASNVAAGGMLAAAATCAVAARKLDPPASLLLGSLVAWLAFATRLSGELRRKNQLLSAD